MEKITNKYNLIAIIMILILALLLPFAVYAKNAGAEANQSQSDSGVSNNSDNSNAKSNSQSDNSSGASTQNKLQAKNLETCQNRERVMNNIMTRVGDRGQKQIKVVESIHQKVQNFYTEKNISIANYDELNATIEAKKMIANKEMESVRAMNGNFSCGGNNPKGVITQFKSEASAQSDAIKEYKNAVHDLVVEIKTALSSDVNNETTEEN